MFKKCLFLITFISNNFWQSSYAMECSTEECSFVNLPKDILSEILPYVLYTGTRNIDDVIKSYKNYINLIKVNKHFYNYLNQIVDYEKNLTRYQQMLLQQLNDQDIAKINNTVSFYLSRRKYSNDLIILLKLLLSLKKLDPNLQTLINNDRKEGRTIFSWAVDNGYKKLIELLIKAGAKPYEKDMYGGITPLMRAAAKGNLEIANILIDAGVNIDETSLSNETALHWAAYYDKNNIVQMLIDSGANIEATDHHGNTPIMTAVVAGNIDIVKTLISKGANVNAKDKNGLSVLQTSADLIKRNDGSYEAIVALLKNAGAH